MPKNLAIDLAGRGIPSVVSTRCARTDDVLLSPSGIVFRMHRQSLIQGSSKASCRSIRCWIELNAVSVRTSHPFPPRPPNPKTGCGNYDQLGKLQTPAVSPPCSQCSTAPTTNFSASPIKNAKPFYPIILFWFEYQIRLKFVSRAPQTQQWREFADMPVGPGWGREKFTFGKAGGGARRPALRPGVLPIFPPGVVRAVSLGRCDTIGE